MFRLVRRLARPLAFLVIAAQLLLAVPAMANASVSAAAATGVHCDHMKANGMKAHGDAPCPCCPDGASSMTDCLVTCMLTAVAAPAIFVATIDVPNAPSFVQTTFAADPFFQPPLNPPPID